MTDYLPTNPATVRKAARYWADLLRKRKKGYGNVEVDSEDLAAAISITDRYAVGGQNADGAGAFEDALYLAIYGAYNPYGLDIHTNPDPDIYLTKAAELAGITLGVFDLPFNCYMVIHGDKITVNGVELP